MKKTHTIINVNNNVKQNNNNICYEMKGEKEYFTKITFVMNLKVKTNILQKTSNKLTNERTVGAFVLKSSNKVWKITKSIDFCCFSIFAYTFFCLN